MESLHRIPVQELPPDENDILYWAREQLEALLRKGVINRDDVVRQMKELRSE